MPSSKASHSASKAAKAAALMPEKHVAMVTGATGITGRHCVERLCA
jgi:hypothetical protein